MTVNEIKLEIEKGDLVNGRSKVAKAEMSRVILEDGSYVHFQPRANRAEVLQSVERDGVVLFQRMRQGGNHRKKEKQRR